jgi:hypothetical protein
MYLAWRGEPLEWRIQSVSGLVCCMLLQAIKYTTTKLFSKPVPRDHQRSKQLAAYSLASFNLSNQQYRSLQVWMNQIARWIVESIVKSTSTPMAGCWLLAVYFVIVVLTSLQSGKPYVTLLAINTAITTLAVQWCSRHAQHIGPLAYFEVPSL